MIWAYTMTPSIHDLEESLYYKVRTNSSMILACIYAQSLSSLNSAWSGLSELDFDDSIYSVEFHASKILLLITGTWKSSWNFLHCTKNSYQSSGTGGSRYSCWRVPVNCTGSTAILICWIRWTLLIVWFPTRRREFASPRLYVGPALFLVFYPPSSPLIIYSCLL